MANKMCPYSQSAAHLPRGLQVRGNMWGWPTKPYRQKRITCPECGRRLVARVSHCSDGCCTYYTIPMHKPKRWWKGGDSGKRVRQKKRELKRRFKYADHPQKGKIKSLR